MHFWDYLFHALSFMVDTDNNPLMYALTCAKLNATGYRWVAELANYNFTLWYHPRDNSANMDGLSHMPKDMESYMEKCAEEVCQDVISASVENVAVERGSLCQEVGVVKISALDLVKDDGNSNPGQ